VARVHDHDPEKIAVDYALSRNFGKDLRCGCIWFEGRHAVIAGDCWLHSPRMPWGLPVLRAARWYRPILESAIRIVSLKRDER
jgi:hypothetical protein